MANTNNKKWSDRHWVFRRGGRPCWKCMTQIATDYNLGPESLSGVLKCQGSWYPDVNQITLVLHIDHLIVAVRQLINSFLITQSKGLI